MYYAVLTFVYGYATDVTLPRRREKKRRVRTVRTPDNEPRRRFWRDPFGNGARKLTDELLPISDVVFGGPARYRERRNTRAARTRNVRNYVSPLSGVQSNDSAETAPVPYPL